MRTSETVFVPAAAPVVFPHVASLDRYPAWLPLVHEAIPDESHPLADDRPAWLVEIRARVGPLARSKQLRMERTVVESDRLAVFERAEIDGRDHARWALRAELAERDGGGTLVTMHLAYEGGLWTAGVMERVLEEEVRRGREGLLALLSAAPRQ